jgi:molecular chaperone DnaJ
MPKRCYYEVLGVTRDSDPAEIKKAFRKAAIQYHPDKNPGDSVAEEKFKEASEAYQVLSDAERRRVYDQYGHAGLDSQLGSGFAGFEDIFSHFGDILGDLFGNRNGRARGPQRGADLRYDLELSFEEAAFGCPKQVQYQRHEPCSRCSASGAEPGTSATTCGTCRGAGRVTRQQGFFMVQTTCPVCKGRGKTIEKRCKTCHGEGMAVVDKTVSVSIPAGVDDGVRMRVTGEGESGPQGHRGDLYVFIQVRPHAVFRREGADIHSAILISLSQAALGDEIEVATVHGAERVPVPPGTQHGTALRLKRKGLSRLNGHGQGDHFVTLQVQVPVKLDKDQRKALQALREAGL